MIQPCWVLNRNDVLDKRLSTRNADEQSDAPKSAKGAFWQWRDHRADLVIRSVIGQPKRASSMMQHSVSESWNRIAAWLRSNAPQTLACLQPPATVEQLEAAARQLALPFPDDFWDLYETTNGSDSEGKSFGIFPSLDEWGMAFSPLALDQIIRESKIQKELLEMGDFADLVAEASEGVANDWWNMGWIPFADNGSGDYYCVDMAPTSGGTVGQVISHSHESGERRKLANSLAEYLGDLADSLESGSFEYDDAYGIRRKNEERQAARHVREVKNACQNAETAFRNKDYETVVGLLAPFERELDKTAAMKLAYARKKCQQ